MANLLEVITNLTTGQVPAAIAVLVLISAIIIIRQEYHLNYPNNLPRIGEPPGKTSFSLKTRLAYYNDTERLFNEAYHTYSKNGKTCLLGGLGFRTEVLLPTSALKWAAAQPDSVLSIGDAFLLMDHAEYSAGHGKYVSDGWQGTLVKTQMNVVLESIVVGMCDELGYAFDARFGTNENEWTELKLYEKIKLIVAQGSSRFTVGLPLCRNEEWIQASNVFPDRFLFTAGFIGIFPKLLRPAVGALVYVPNWFLLRKMSSLLKPIFDQRMPSLAHPKSEKEPRDHLQMILREAHAKHPDELNLHDITRRIAFAITGAYHQTSIAVTNILFNILESDPEFNTIAILREEIQGIIGNKGEWTKADVSRMVRCDSVMRESLRLHSFGKRSVLRAVMVDGVVTEDGIALPKGCLVSMLTTAGLDPEKFEDPTKFDPFRSSREREEASDKVKGNLSYVTTGVENLAFGHGKHACPGRFLVDFEMKMILAYLLVNYDIALPAEYGGKRPKSFWVAEAMFVPNDGKIKVKRRVK